MTEVVTRTIEQLPAAAGTLPTDLIAVQRPGGGVQRVPIGLIPDTVLRDELADSEAGGSLVAVGLPTGNAGDLQRVADAMPIYATLHGITYAPGADRTTQMQDFIDLCVSLDRRGVWDIPFARVGGLIMPANTKLGIRDGGELRSLLADFDSDADQLIEITGGNVDLGSERGGEWTISADDPADHWGYAIKALGPIARTRIRNLRSRNVKHSMFGTSAANYAAANLATNCPTDIKISGGGCDMDTPTPGLNRSGAILLYHVDGARVSDMTFKNVPSAVQAWGGNANPSADGAKANARKCRNIRIRDLDIVGATEAFIFLCMAEDAKVWNSTGTNAGDTGFDTEGCNDFWWFNCSGSECGTGVFTLFFLNGRGGWINPVARQSIAANGLAFISNPSQTIENEELRIVNPDFECTSGIGSVDLIAAIGVLSVEGGRSRNVQWLINGNNNYRINFRHDLDFTVAAGAAFRAVDIDGLTSSGLARPASATVKGTSVRSRVAQPAGSKALVLASSDTNSNPTLIVSDSESEGFATDIEFVSAGSNAGFAVVAHAYNNRLGAKVITLTDTGAGTPTLHKAGNVGLYDGAAV